ncbi:MAG: hypothetical protein MRY21_00815 [Simkaniaceae bacterium]|nr:hypothetical protein [Simkaniaceae bacterium]
MGCLFLNADPVSDVNFEPIKVEEIGWIDSYFENIDDSVTVDELVDFLYEVRCYFLGKGYYMPDLSYLSQYVYQVISENGTKIPFEVRELICEKIFKRERALLNRCDYSAIKKKANYFN